MIKLKQENKKCYYGKLKHLKSKLLTYTKLKLYKALIKIVLMFGSETWVLTESVINQLFIFERKILQQISHPG